MSHSTSHHRNHHSCLCPIALCIIFHIITPTLAIIHLIILSHRVPSLPIIAIPCRLPLLAGCCLSAWHRLGPSNDWQLRLFYTTLRKFRILLHSQPKHTGVVGRNSTKVSLPHVENWDRLANARPKFGVLFPLKIWTQKLPILDGFRQLLDLIVKIFKTNST